MSCTQPLLIHADGTGSCSMPGCLDQGTLMEAVNRHRYVVNCRTALGNRCAVCHRGTDDDGATAPPEGGTGAMCPGVAVVHADLSFECSEPGCATTASRDGWLARHGDVQSCSEIHGGCALCSAADDHR